MNHSNSNSNTASRTAVAMHSPHTGMELEHRYNAVETFLQLVGLDPNAVVEFMRKERTVEEVRIFAGKTV
jgi:hypothetical protein